MNNLNKNNFIPDYNKFRIFQIGFNKCGTTSLFKLFKNFLAAEEPILADCIDPPAVPDNFAPIFAPTI